MSTTPDGSLDTGTGGFSIEGELYGFDVGVPDDRGGSQGKWSSGLVGAGSSPTAEHPDLTAPTVERLGQYLSQVTNASLSNSPSPIPNAYPIDNKKPVKISLTDSAGYPAPLTPGNNDSQFSDLPDQNAYRNKNDIESPIAFKKGLSQADGPDGNTLLHFTGQSDQPSQIPAYVNNLLNNNRFSNANPYNASFQADVSVERLGQYEPGKKRLSQEQLNQVGELLILRSAGTLGSLGMGVDPSGVGLEITAAIVPSPVQVCAAKVDTVLLETGDVMSAVADSVTSTNKFSVSDKSWGVMNSPAMQFSGTSSAGLAVLATALIAALEIAVQSFAALASVGGPVSGASYNRSSVGTYTLGSYRGKADKTNSSFLNALTNLDILSAVGISPTITPFSVALSLGVSAFFGLDTGSLSPRAMLSSPGHSVVIARAILRSAEVLTTDFTKIFASPMDAVTQTLNFVDALRASKVVMACNVFAQLGDAILLNVPEPVSTLEPVSNSRMGGSSLKRAWAGNNTPSNLLLPNSIVIAKGVSNADGAPDMGMSLSGQDPFSRTNVVLSPSRLDQSTVRVIENTLDAEYVPFYFHDLRTNEVISFHAFLDSLSDALNPTYESSSGFGRVDEVKVYKSTSRKITFSFAVAATSPTDFDEMWLKLNKLSTLVYPQYTAGKLISNGSGFSVRQPFSQLIGASPLIRLRIGDVVRSNYSKFALGRLFGLGDTGMTLNNKTVSSAVKPDQIAVQTLIQNAFTGNSTVPVAFNVMHGSYPFAGVTNESFAPLFNSVDDPVLEASIVMGGFATPDHNSVYVRVQLTQDPSIANVPFALSNAMLKYSDVSNRKTHVVGGTYVVPVSALRITQYTLSNAVQQKLLVGTGSDFTSFQGQYADFMNTDSTSSGNAVAKSFETVSGKGLAGFLDSLTFDMMEGTWEVFPDRTAPKIVKISTSLSVVHDISPGIDSYGFNRAPLYPIGYMANAKRPNDTLALTPGALGG